MERNRQRKRNRNASDIEVDRELEAQPEPSQAQKNMKASGEARRDRHDNNTWHAKKAKRHTVMRGVCAAGLEAGAVVASEVVEARVAGQSILFHQPAFMDKDRHAAGKHVINRRDVRSSNTNLGLEFAVLGLCCLAGAVGIYTEDVRLTALIFLGGLGAWLMQGLPAALKGTAAAAKHKKAQVQGILAVPPDQLLQLLKGRRSVAPKDYTGAKVGGAVQQQAKAEARVLGVQVQQQRGAWVDRSAIELCLEAARWAPTHNLTQPWRFVVLEGEAKTKFETLTIDLVGQYTTPADKSEEAVARLKGKASKTWPLVSHYIVICMQPKSSEKSGKKNPEWEEIAAVSCAVQNLALMATAQGLAGYWSSWQAAARDAPEMAAFLGIDPTQGDKCLGVYSLGLSDRLAGYKGSRAPIADKTSWLS
ncbi:hypothetical protein QJQ45_023726 [Haematococcus lacustris]|nr:hypothetical protein QJQ45_023726 [Haematococcus lacustris]